MGVANYGAAATCLGVSRGCAVHRDADKVLAVVEEQIAVFGLAEPHSIFDDCIENRIQLTGRTTNDFEHFRGRRLLLQ
jgi:hypothetical protein